MTDNDVIIYFYGAGKKKLNKKLLHDIPEDIHKYLDSRFSDSSCIEETVQRIKLNISKHPLCICSAPVRYVGGTRVFLQSCGCKVCSNKINQMHVRATSIERYGVSNPAKTNTSKEKQKATNIERYGYTCALQNPRIKEKTAKTNIVRYGSEIAQQSSVVKEKIASSNEKTCLDKYGVKNIAKLGSINEQRKLTCLERYGVDNIAKSELFIEQLNKTSIRKYGTPYPSQSQEIKDKILNSIIKTNLERYGKQYVFEVDEIKEKAHINHITSLIRKYGVDNPGRLLNVQEKIQNTKRKNGTFNTSAHEDMCYELLCEKYGVDNIERQYKSDVYPFRCDFYVKPLDLYIEYNGGWTHGGKPYTGSDEDNAKLSKWKTASTPYYNNAIHTWTIRDVNKRNIAKQNNLNYLEFWNMSSFELWVKNQNY